MWTGFFSFGRGCLVLNALASGAAADLERGSVPFLAESLCSSLRLVSDVSGLDDKDLVSSRSLASVLGLRELVDAIP